MLVQFQQAGPNLCCCGEVVSHNLGTIESQVRFLSAAPILVKSGDSDNPRSATVRFGWGKVVRIHTREPELCCVNFDGEALSCKEAEGSSNLSRSTSIEYAPADGAVPGLLIQVMRVRILPGVPKYIVG